MAGDYLFFIIAFFLLLIVLRVPIAFSMLISCFAFILLSGRLPLSNISQGMVSGLGNYAVMASPFFILVSYVMNHAGVTEQLFEFANCLVGHIKGGLAHVNVLASLIFAGMSGSANADAAGLGNIEIHAMKEKGFDADFAVGITAASSTIGPIFPPSNPMVYVGIFANVSIGAMFYGGVVVGVLMALFMCVTVYVIARKRNYPVEKRATMKQLWKSFRDGFWALLTPVILLYCLQNGNITPTEAGAFAFVYALFISMFIYKKLKFRDLYGIFEQAVNSVGIVLLFVSTGKVFTWALGDQQVGETVARFLFSLSQNPWVVLLLINLFLLFLGTFMETVAAITIAAPILFPIARSLGINPVQFGVIFVLNLMIGLLTPPMAICLSITSKIGGISFERAFKAVTPYYIALLLVLLLINLFPILTLGLPHLLLGGYM
ncbi:MAG: TRAP transporter large permease [Synergistaceae bacterium]|jgi:tripartite ATP-independent transporter DctM subunit|nr:TRAP transporter large permease [Synergistaceae bacterium]